MDNKFFDYTLYCNDMHKLDLKQKNVISTINTYSFLAAEKNKVFKQALLESNVLLPDGQGIVWATNLLYKKRIKKIAGHDIFIFLLNHLNENSGSCFFLGSSEETLLKIRERISSDFSNIKVDAYSPPFKDKFSVVESNGMINKINGFAPDILFVGMTAPKQEKWVLENKDKIKSSTIASIGAVFDFYAGNVKRPSKFWIDLGLEWFIRFFQEPKRLFKRNLYSILFIIKIFRAKISRQF